ncbi:OppA family ABC transporter substrate-binding lipoprotein [Mycoplasmopsis glycophila]|uniref:Lipoprotein n=1 Tax=Mycoplasmopsis glycophila TaxID=171285 RepID=A0A449AVF2_9BACT|nr:hypothetical protein [Mycoplasmopsis glycophila]VEU70555.1 Uncharacterised protein [Mycoplasmopsis glycophila]
MKRKWLLLSSVLTTTLPLTAVAAACSQETTKQKKRENVSADVLVTKVEYLSGNDANLSNFARQGVYKWITNATYNLKDFRWDRSWLYGGKEQYLEDGTTATLISFKAIGKAMYDEVVDVNDEGVETKSIKILNPSGEAMVLEQADAIVITTNDGVEHVYDSDEAELLPAPDVDGKYYSETVVTLLSNNPKSVNSLQFQDDLKNAKKVSFRVRKGAKWVDKNGNETEYNVSAYDYWAGLVRTLLFTGQYRLAHGGKEEIDEAMKGLLYEPGKLLDSKTSYGNSYLFDLYNVNFANLLEKDSAVSTDSEGNTYFNIEKKNLSETALFDEILKNIYANYEFTPMPYEYVSQNQDTPVIETLKPLSGDNAFDKEAYKAQIVNAEGLAKELGFYWYGTTIDNTLFSGKYYGTPYNGNTLIEEIRLNTHYSNKEFLKDKQNVLVFQEQYQSSGVDQDAFIQTAYNTYLSGDNATIGYSSLPKNLKDNVDQNKEKFGISYVKALNTDVYSKLKINTMVPTVPGGNNAGKYTFDDLASQLLYGHTINDVYGATDVVEKYSTGISIEFRTILQAAINWEPVANDLTPNRPSSPWLSPLAQDARIKDDYNDDSLAENNLRANAEAVNTLFVVDSETGAKVNLGSKIGTEISQSENSSLDKNEDDKYKSSAFDLLSKRMTALLDRLYAQTSTPETTKVNIPYFFRYINPTPPILMTFEKLAKTMNTLDQKGRLNISFTYSQNADGWRAHWGSGGFEDLTAWGYDYKTIGSGLDGITTQSKLVNLFAQLSTDSNLASRFGKAFPRLVEAAKAFKAYVEKIESEGALISIPFADWAALNPTLLADFSHALGSYKLNDAKDDYVELTEEEQARGRHLTISDITSKFWLNYNNSSAVTKKSLLELANELVVYFGFTFDHAMTIGKTNFSPTISNPSYIRPQTNQNFLDFGWIKLGEEKLS